MTARELHQGLSQRKVRGGKLVRVRLIHDGERVRSVRITGDFLLHPEEALEAIEARLTGLPLDIGREVLLSRIGAEVRQRRAQLIGFTEEDLADLVLEAVG